jgi:Tfp pilus assembly protein PilF
MFTVRQIRSCQPLLLLAVFAVTCPAERSASGAQTVSGSARSINPRNRQAKQLVADGLAAFERGDHTSARTSFQKALELDPQEVTAHTYLGIIADKRRRPQRAEQHFSAAVTAEPLSRVSEKNNYGRDTNADGRVSLARSSSSSRSNWIPIRPMRS